MGARAPRQSEGLAERIARVRAETDKLVADLDTRPALPPWPTKDNLTADHPLSRAFGLERARELVDPLPPVRVLEAAKRREVVLELSLQRRPVREIASAAGLTYYSTIKVRGRLRREGKLR